MPSQPHAYLKLWKQHSAERQAQRIVDAAPAFLRRTGGRTSSEWSLAKAMEMAEEAPQVWAQTERWIEAGDWIVWQLTGVESRSRCLAAYKAHYDDELGYPAQFLPDFAQRLETGTPPLPLGAPAGVLTKAWLDATGIVGPTVVATAVIDAHAVLPAVGVVEPGTWLGTLGTSACYLALGDAPLEMAGLSGSVLGGALPSLWCHEAGQPAFGDALAWCATTLGGGDVPLEEWSRRSAALPPGQDRLLALDWWNGNRCPHGDTALSGLIVGMTPATTAVEMFRAVETGLCFGARRIRDDFVAHGVAHDRVLMTGGVAERGPQMLQRMADVLGHEIEVPRLANATAVGAAIHAAMAAGVGTFDEAARRLGAKAFDIVRPQAAAVARFDALYALYGELASSQAVLSTLRGLHALGRPCIL
jgi:L-ribulokinase